MFQNTIDFAFDVAKFFSTSDQRPDLAIQDLRNFFVEISSNLRPVNPAI